MINEILLVGSAVAANLILALLVRRLGKAGLVCWVSLATILANVIVSRQVDMFGLHVTLANVLFASVFTACELMVEHFGKENGEELKRLILFVDVAAIAIEQGALLFVENEFDTVSDALKMLFQFSARSTFASVVCFYAAVAIQVKLYGYLKDRLPAKYMLRNFIPSVVCNCVENFLFFIIGFLGVMSFGECFELALTCCVNVELVDVINMAFAPLHRCVTPVE